MPLTTGPHLSTSLDAFTAATIPGFSNDLHRSPFRSSDRSLPPRPSPPQLQSGARRPVTVMRCLVRRSPNLLQAFLFATSGFSTPPRDTEARMHSLHLAALLTGLF